MRLSLFESSTLLSSLLLHRSVNAHFITFFSKLPQFWKEYQHSPAYLFNISQKAKKGNRLTHGCDLKIDIRVCFRHPKSARALANVTIAERNFIVLPEWYSQFSQEIYVSLFSLSLVFFMLVVGFFALPSTLDGNKKIPCLWLSIVEHHQLFFFLFSSTLDSRDCWSWRIKNSVDSMVISFDSTSDTLQTTRMWAFSWGEKKSFYDVKLVEQKTQTIINPPRSVWRHGEPSSIRESVLTLPKKKVKSCETDIQMRRPFPSGEWVYVQKKSVIIGWIHRT